MFKKYLSVVLVLLSTNVFAQEYKINIDNQFNVVIPQEISIKIEKYSENKAVSCKSLFKQLEVERSNIERCSVNGLQPKRFCKIFKSKIQKLVYGIINERIGRYENDAEQSFEITPRFQDYSIDKLLEISSDKNVDVDSLISIKAEKIELNVIGADADIKSFSFLFHLAPVLGIKMDIHPLNTAEGSFLNVHNRLSSCELINGGIRLIGEANIEYSYEALDVNIDLDDFWIFSKKLRKEFETRFVNKEKKKLWAGFLMAKFISEKLNEELTPEKAEEIISIFMNENKENVAKYLNKFKLSKKLTTKTRFREMMIDFEVRNEVSN